MGRNSPFILPAVLAVFAGLVSCAPPSQREPPLTPEGKAYVRNLPLSDVSMKASDSYARQTLTEIEGKVQNTGNRTVDRWLPRDHGFCPHVVVRHRALVLEDVRDYPRFACNPVVDEYGIHSYLGAPLIDSTGKVLGTVCVADVAPRPWGKAGLETIKARAAELAVRIERRADDGFPL